ncbi:MAG: DUF4214 domain-containing protein [Undibacterium umbellatum]|uniref:DUF4214 domain-containing protein n=1 Tax=Undibacterium umbellatum TaxID=2762300 RepID=UPI003BB4A3AD
MATYIPYYPSNPITRAMFNFDGIVPGFVNYILSGYIRVSVSDSFPADVNQGGSDYPWTQTQLGNINAILDIYSQFANLSFSSVVDYDVHNGNTLVTPAVVGAANLSDININWLNRKDLNYSGESAGANDKSFGYTGAAGDIVLNQATAQFQGDYTLGPYSHAAQTLMHELGHSLGLSHPHSIYKNGVPIITADYAVTQSLGFNLLGFKTTSAQDMYKEYFSIMSYDDQNYSAYLHAYTPMILDVIALQLTYGEGKGTSGSGDDTIISGTDGYRTYFDKGGIDTVDLSMYSLGAYFSMGFAITGAPHLVGVAMSYDDGLNTILKGGDPVSLRWFYGEYENAIGSAKDDIIAGNSLSNNIKGGAGNDLIGGWGGNDLLFGEAGNDSMEGGDGNDTMMGGDGDDRFDWVEGFRAGNDVMVGGRGNDAYVLDSMLDQVLEGQNEGVDTVWVNFNSSLSSFANVENLRAYDSASVRLTGNAGNNLMSGSTGNDTIDGAAGKDVVYYAGNASRYQVSKSGNSFIVKDSTGQAGTDILSNVELLEFEDHYVSFDVNGIAGQAYRLYQAAFDRKPDFAGLGYWIKDMELGSSLTTVAAGFFSSAEFQKLYGKAPSNTTLITNFYSNVLHRSPDKAGFDYWLTAMDSGKISAAGALASFCESTENQALVIGVIQNGIEFQEWLG